METETIVKAKVKVNNTNIDIHFEEGGFGTYIDSGAHEIYLSTIDCIMDCFEDGNVEDFICRFLWSARQLPHYCSFINIKDDLSYSNYVEKHKKEYKEEVDDNNVNLIDRVGIGYGTKLCDLNNWQEVLIKEIKKGNIFVVIATGECCYDGVISAKVSL